MTEDCKCVVCDEAITNPICPACLELQVMHWIGEVKPTLVPILRGIGDSVEVFSNEASTCVICNRTMSVCPHCYCKDIFEWLTENNYPEIAFGFRYHFNFELNHDCDDSDWIPEEHLNKWKAVG